MRDLFHSKIFRKDWHQVIKEICYRALLDRIDSADERCAAFVAPVAAEVIIMPALCTLYDWRMRHMEMGEFLGHMTSRR
jgi:hypothetical protein